MILIDKDNEQSPIGPKDSAGRGGGWTAAKYCTHLGPDFISLDRPVVIPPDGCLWSSEKRGMSRQIPVVVVRLPRPMEGLQFSDPYRTASSTTGDWSCWNILMCFYIYYSEHYGLSFLDLTDAIFFTRSPFLVNISIFASTLCMCVMYLTSI